MQEVSGAYNSPFLYTDELKMALPARKVSGCLVSGLSRDRPLGSVSQNIPEIFGERKAIFSSSVPKN